MHRKELCVTLVIYQESLHDARPTKYKNFLLSFCVDPHFSFVASRTHNPEIGLFHFKLLRNFVYILIQRLSPNNAFACILTKKIKTETYRTLTYV